MTSFDELAEEQGWSYQTIIFLLRQFIAEAELREELDAFAVQQATHEKIEAGRTKQ